MQHQKVSMSQNQFRIGDLANELKVKKFVIRFWEEQFDLESGRSSGGHRSYTQKDMRIFQMIKDLLYQQGYTIEGARKRLPEMLKDLEAQELAQAHKNAEVVVQEAAPVHEAIVEHEIAHDHHELVGAHEAVLEVLHDVSGAQEVVLESRHEVSGAQEVVLEARHEVSGAHEVIEAAMPEAHHEVSGAHEVIETGEQTAGLEAGPVQASHVIVEQQHAPASSVPCMTCQHHSHQLTMVKQHLLELKQRMQRA